MQSDNFTISVLFGTGVVHPEIQEILESLPQLKLLEQTCDPEGYSTRPHTSPDIILIELDGHSSVPSWLERLAQKMPQTPMLLCSHTLEPEFLIRLMQVGIREFLPMPLSREALEAALNRVLLARRQNRAGVNQGLGKVIVVTSHKGGAGVTTVAVNLAVAWTELVKEPIALVDLGRPFPDVGNFLDQDPGFTILDLVHNLDELDQSFIQRIMQPYGQNLNVLHGWPDFREQDNLEQESLGRIFSLLRTLYKYTIVDLGHWLDAFFLQVVMEADVILLLTGLTVPDLRNLKKLWPALLEWHQEKRKIKLVVNRFDRSNGLVLRDLEQIIQQPVYSTLPSDYFLIMESLNRGVPLGVSGPRSKLWQSLKTLTEQVKRECPGGQEQAVLEVAEPKRRFWLMKRGKDK